jgi:hypothetical protein
MARYEVVIPWHGKAKGDVIETDKLHDALKPNVRQIAFIEKAEPEPVVAEQKQTRRGRPPKDKE